MVLDPKSPQAHDVAALLRASIDAARAGQPEHAHALLLRVIALDQGNLAAWLWLSGVVPGLRERKRCLERVLGLEPSHVAARRGLALVDEELADALVREGIAAARAGDRERASSLLREVLELDEDRAVAWLWLSSLTPDLAERRTYLERALALDPASDVAREGLMLVRRQSAAQLVRQGAAAAQAGDTERAERLLRQAIDEDDENVGAWLWLSGVVPTVEEQRACLQQALLLDPNSQVARDSLAHLRRASAERLLQEGIASARAGERETARGLLAQAVEPDSCNPTAWLWLSGVMPDEESQRACLGRVLALEPDNALAQAGLARLETHRFEESVEPTESAQSQQGARSVARPSGRSSTGRPFASSRYARSLSMAGAALLVIGLMLGGPALAEFAVSRPQPAQMARSLPSPVSASDAGDGGGGATGPAGTSENSTTGLSVDGQATATGATSSGQSATPIPTSQPATLISSHTPFPTASPRPIPTPTETPAPTITAMPTASPLPPSPTPAVTTVYTPSRIIIPSVNIDGSIVPAGLEIDETAGVPQSARVVPEATRAGWHDTSAPLGVPGNTVINGHNWPENGIFRELYKVEPGALVMLYSGEKVFGYEVVEAIIVQEAGQPIEVRQANASRLMPTDDERVTIITCHPYGGTRDRLIVTAKPVADGDGEVDPWDGTLAQ